MQVSAHLLGGEVTSAPSGEYGRVGINYLTHPLFKGISAENICWMSHTDYVSKLPQGFSSIAHTDKVNNAAMANDTLKIYGLQFHPKSFIRRKGLR
jgi:GMP synthase (glutamine-hydrolysing)